MGIIGMYNILLYIWVVEKQEQQKTQYPKVKLITPDGEYIIEDKPIENTSKNSDGWDKLETILK